MFGWMEKRKRGAQYQPEFSGVLGGILITGNAGLIEGTRVASNLGWRTVDALCVGDEVLTFDHGMQKIVDIQREVHDHKLQPWQRPIRVPSGAMENRRDLWLMPDQGLLVECDALEDRLGDPFAVISAKALKGVCDIEAIATDNMFQVTTMSFENDEAVYVDGGMLAYCPRPRALLGERRDDEVIYNVLDANTAHDLVQDMITLDGTGGFACDPEEIAGIAPAKRLRPGRPAPV